jgi:putative transposase
LFEVPLSQVYRWEWVYLSTMLDDFSHYIIAWKLCTTMKAEDVTPSSKWRWIDKARVLHRRAAVRQWLHISDDLGEMAGALRHGQRPPRSPYHPTQGKIERWHQTLKNRILLENYSLPGDPEAQIEAFVADFNHRRYHESIGNLTPADVHSDAARIAPCKLRAQV